MTKRRALVPITAERLRELLHYDQETGEFRVARSRPGARRLGSVAGTIANRGYRMIRIGGRSYAAHRLAWLWMTGCFPPHEIDHINLSRADNRWGNLREATHPQNTVNTVCSASNTSGFKGAHLERFKPRPKPWRATVQVNGRRISLGYFATPEEAHTAYFRAAQGHFGQFANDGKRRVWLFGRCALHLRAMGGGRDD